MIIIKATLLTIIIFVCSSVIGQSNVITHKEEPSRNIDKHEGVVVIKQMYYEDTHVLKTYFLTNEVKNGFPGYNYALNKDENALEIEKWLMIKENKNSLTEEGIKAIESYIKSK